MRADVTGPYGPSTDLSYTGQRDLGMGLLDYHARFYSPVLGRFSQPDSLIPDASNPQAWNRYSYVSNRPVNLNDPTGHMQSSDEKSGGGRCNLKCLETHNNKRQELQTAKNIVDSQGKHYSMSTKINTNTVLSHDHYGFGYLTGGEYQMSTLMVADGEGFPLFAYDGNGDLTGGTSLLTVNGDLPGFSASLASQDTISMIQPGDLVDVVYWDDSAQTSAIGTFSVSEIHLDDHETTFNNGYININSGGTISAGDSGSGIFYEGQLIGNISSTNYVVPSVFGLLFPTSSQGELLPAYINQSSTATTPVK